MTTIDQTVNKIKKDLALMSDWHDRKTMDVLLTRDWFIDEDEIDELLDSADEDAWEWVYANRKKYSTRIRMLIEPDDYRVPVEKLKIRLGDLTDSMMEKIELDQKKKLDEAFEKDWVEHSKSIQDRGFSNVDSNLDDAWDNFCRARNVLTKYIEKPTAKKYVAPSIRDKEIIDSKRAELESIVHDMENEYDAAQKLVDDTDFVYWELEKNEYRKIWMPTL
jgi:hypothetical protein